MTFKHEPPVETTESQEETSEMPVSTNTGDGAAEALREPENTPPEAIASNDRRQQPTQPRTSKPTTKADRLNDAQEHQQEAQHDTATPEAAEEPENTPQGDAPETDTLQQEYAALKAKVANLEAKEAARIEAEAKSAALTEAGIKGNYGQLLTGSRESWGQQIDLLRRFAADNPPRPRDPAVDVSLGDGNGPRALRELLRDGINNRRVTRI